MPGPKPLRTLGLEAATTRAMAPDARREGGSAGGAVLPTEAQLAAWGAAIRTGTMGVAAVSAKVRQALFEAGIRGLAASRAFDTAMRRVFQAASGQGGA